MGAEARPPRYGPLRLVAAAAGGAIFTLVFLRSPFSCPDVPGLVSSHNKPGSQLSIPAVAGTEAPVTNAEPPVTNAEPVSLGAKAKPDGAGCGRACETCTQFCFLVEGLGFLGCAFRVQALGLHGLGLKL